MAACLRAASHWEDHSYARFIEAYKRQFAEQMRMDENVNHTELSSIVGTLDLNIRHFSCGETILGEHVKSPAFSNIYGLDQTRYVYVANLCVAKNARREGIATNLLLLTVDAARSHGINQIYVHVNKDNIAAQRLYDQIGFQMVQTSVPRLLVDDKKDLLYRKGSKWARVYDRARRSLSILRVSNNYTFNALKRNN